MATTVDQAIKDRWISKNLGNTITGGVHFSELPRADSTGAPITIPYAVVSHITKSPVLWTNKSQYHDHEVQFNIYDDTKAGLESQLETVKTAFDFAPLSIEDADVLEVRPTNDDGLIEKQDDGMWQGILTYRIRYRKSVNYEPS